jgi:hypothetical protein
VATVVGTGLLLIGFEMLGIGLGDSSFGIRVRPAGFPTADRRIAFAMLVAAAVLTPLVAGGRRPWLRSLAGAAVLLGPSGAMIFSYVQEEHTGEWDGLALVLLVALLTFVGYPFALATWTGTWRARLLLVPVLALPTVIVLGIAGPSGWVLACGALHLVLQRGPTGGN